MAGQTTVLRIFGFRYRAAAQADKETASEKTGATVGAPLESSDPSSRPVADVPKLVVTPASPSSSEELEGKQPAVRKRRLSWLPLATKPPSHESKPTSTTPQDTTPASPATSKAEKKEPEKKKGKESSDPTRNPLIRARSTQQRYLQSALVLRELIVGPSSSSAPGRLKAKAPSGAQLEKVRAQLAQPKTANKVIAQLRELPSSDEPVALGTGPDGASLTVLCKGPIHAVCLPYQDADAHARHFARLERDGDGKCMGGTVFGLHIQIDVGSVANASITQLKAVLAEIDVVSLVMTPGFGLGQPGDSPGILSGAVPTAKAIIDGVEQVTPQLMALGYATGKSILPNHDGVYPPIDRISVLTYWWGLEVVLPPPTIAYLNNVPSIAHAVINFLSALALVEGGVREILPFVRYISQFIDTEFGMIKEQDKGKGVVCAATWLMPAALVPRPWDFVDPPPKAVPVSAPSASLTSTPVAPTPPVSEPQPTKSVPEPESPTSTAPVVPPIGAPIIAPDTINAVDETAVTPPTETIPTSSPLITTKVLAQGTPDDEPAVEVTPISPASLKNATEGTFGEGLDVAASPNEMPAAVAAATNEAPAIVAEDVLPQSDEGEKDAA